MSILDKLIGGKKKTRLVALTDIGQEKIEQSVGDESKTRFRIMSDLAEHGSSSVKEIAERTGIEESRISHICDILISESLVRKVNE